MNLSVDLIYEELQKRYRCRMEGEGDFRLSLQSIYFYQVGMPLYKDAVYLVRPKAGAGAGSLGAGLWIYLTEGPGPGIHLREAADIFEVANALQEIFDRYRKWEQKMQRLADSEADIGQMLLESVEMIGNPMTVVNIHMELVGAVGYDPDREDPWYVLRMGEVPLEYVERLQIRALNIPRTEETFLLQEESAEWVYGVNLFVQEDYSGSLTMTQKRQPFTEARCELLNYLRGYIEDAVVHREYAKRIYLNPVITALGGMLDGSTGYEKQLEEKICEWLALQQMPDRWLTAALKPESGVKITAVESLVSGLQDLFSSAIVFSYRDDVICLIVLSDEEETRGKLEFLRVPMTKIGMSVGVSFPFLSLREFAASCRQAACAIEMGIALGKKGEIFYVSRYLLSYMLRKARGECAIRDLQTPGIRRLTEHDERKEVSYIDTLYSFLEHGMNISATAKALYLHHSSLEQRLERIYTLLGSRLEDPDEQLYYRLILRMMKEEKKYIL